MTSKDNQMNEKYTITEFLMTYGWTFLIIIVVVSALYFMNVFEPEGENKCLDIANEFCSKNYMELSEVNSNRDYFICIDKITREKIQYNFLPSELEMC